MFVKIRINKNPYKNKVLKTPNGLRQTDLSPKQPISGTGLNEADLETFTAARAKNAGSLWEEITLRRTDAGQDITVEDYKYFAGRVGKFDHNVFRLGLSWSRSEDPVKRTHGEMILFSQTLNSILFSIDQLKLQFPDTRFDATDLVHLGMLNSSATFKHFREQRRPANTLNKIGRFVFQQGRKEIRQLSNQSLLPITGLSDNDLTGEVLNSYVDPYAEVERAELKAVISEALAVISPSERGVISRVFPADGTRPATLEELAKERGISGIRIRPTLDKLRYYLVRTCKYTELDSPEQNPPSFINEEAREQELIRKFWNGIINAAYLGDTIRCRRIIARLKASLVGIPDEVNQAKIAKLLEKPAHFNADDESVNSLLIKIKADPTIVRMRIQYLEQGEGYIPEQIRKMERLSS